MRPLAVGVLVLVVGSGEVRARVESGAASSGASARQPERLPTLDELLGLGEEGPRREGDRGFPMDDPARRELDRTLDGSEVGQAFVEAVSLMEESAQRIRIAQDTGLTTQRLQEDILRKLDQIIESSQQGQSSSSSSDPEQNQPDQPQQDTQRNQSSSNSSENTDAPAEQDGRPGAPGSLNSASWGALRERLRDALTQGTSDPFSSLYRSMTEEYYKRLAEGEKR